MTIKTERGYFITFEGGEGSGKSTQAAFLCQHLQRIGKQALLTREPGGSKFAEYLRKFILSSDTPKHSPLSEALLFFSARADHLETLIRPALNKGKWIVCDRFIDTTRIYQGSASGAGIENILKLETIVVADTRPDLTIIMDLPVDLAFDRVAKRRYMLNSSACELPDRYESRSKRFHEHLRQGFLDIATAAPDRCTVVDASSNNPEAVSKAVWHVVKTKLFSV
ncbi:MAG: dTMP kinase [Hyphomicrobiaceae bacterium]|nr:dTMP kinase [Hyphomicrobiaceae bacterium]